MKVHSIKTDNANLSHKVMLRRLATKDLSSIKVLDLFAGKNRIWSNFDCERYYGVEKVKGKGKNLWADNLRVIEALNLSDFNVIDCDSYGIPANQIEKIFNNPTFKPGTVVLYTCIGNKMSGLNKTIIQHFCLEKIHQKCSTLINGKSIDLFYAYLYDHGIRKVYEYEEKSQTFTKKYGYFIS